MDNKNTISAEELSRRYGFIVNSSHAFMTLINRDYQYEAVNDVYCTALQRPREEILGKSVEDIWGKTAFDNDIKKHLEKCFSGQVVNYQAWFPVPSKGIRFFNVTYYPYFDEHNTVSHCVVISIDLTEQRKSELKLERVNECLVGLGFDRSANIDEITKVFGSLWNARYIYYNRVTEEPSPQVNATDIGIQNSVLHHAFVKFLEKVMETSGAAPVIKNGEEFVDFMNLTDDSLSFFGKVFFGRNIYFEKQFYGTLAAIFDQPIEFSENDKKLMDILVAALGLEEGRSRAEISLKETKERFQSLYESIPMMVFTVTADGKIVSSNDQATRDLGYSSSNFYGRPIFDFFDNRFAEHIRTQIQNCIKYKDSKFVWEALKRRKNGTTLWVKETGRYFRQSNGAEAVLIISEDISERKSFEDQIFRLNQELERRVLQRTQQLQDINKELEDEIKSRKRVEESLLESQAFLSEAQRIARLGNWEYNLQTKEFKWSEEMLRLVRIQEKDAPKTLDDFLKLVHPDDKHILDSITGKIMTSGQAVELETRFVLDDNSTLYGLLKINPVFRNGQLYKLFGTVQDISEKRLAQNALSESEEKLRSLFENVHDIYFIVSKNGLIEEISPSVERYLDIRKDVILGSHILSGYLYDESDFKKVLFKLYRTKEIVDYELRFKSRSGKMIYSSLNARLRTYPGTKEWKVEGTFRDITDRKLVENQLLQRVTTEEFITTLSTRFINLSVHEVDSAIRDGLKEICNFIHAQAAHIVFSGGKSQKAIVKYRWSAPTLQKINKTFDSVAGTAILKILESKKDLISLHSANIPKECEHCPELESLLPFGVTGFFIIRTHNKRSATGYIGFFSFSKRENALNSELNFLNIVGEIFSNALERKQVEEELIEAKRLAEESNRAKEQFLAHISHELRTPLNAVLGSAYLMLKTQPTAKQLEYIDAITVSADNLLYIVNDLLDFSKIRSGKFVFEKTDFDPRSIINQAFMIVRLTAERKNIKLLKEIDPAVPDYLIGDPGRLSQILLNLLNNAIKFTEKGEVKLAVKVLERTQKNLQLEFKVSDTGIGIPRSKLKIIFEDFVQGGTEKRARESGTGLGLTITKMLVELQSGKISVKSTVNKGSVFTFRLPFLIGKENTIRDTSPEEKSQPGGLENLNILLCEDNEFNQLIIRDLMVHWKAGYKIVPNAKEAIDLLRRSHFDVLLLDIGLPGMNGYELTKYIRTKMPAPVKQIPIIALTASALGDEKMKALQSGMNDYIAKPFRGIDLFMKITNLLSGGSRTATQGKKQNSLIKIRKLPETKYFTPAKILKKHDITVEFLIDLIDSFIATFPGIVDEILHAVEKGNYEKISSFTHKAISMSGYMEISSASALLRKLQKMAKDSQPIEKIRKPADELSELRFVLLDEMKVILTTLAETSNSTPIKRKVTK